jgi:Short C-terminal domain
MFVRRRPLLRSAVVGGAAYMAGKRRAERPADEAEQEDQSVSDQLAQLSMLHDKGALTDAEFASAKARLLGG